MDTKHPIEKALIEELGPPLMFDGNGRHAPAYGCSQPGDQTGTYYPADKVISVIEQFLAENIEQFLAENIETLPDP